MCRFFNNNFFIFFMDILRSTLVKNFMFQISGQLSAVRLVNKATAIVHFLQHFYFHVLTMQSFAINDKHFEIFRI